MVGGRPARKLTVSNENDENSVSTRMTRAKTAALDAEVQATTKPAALQSKKSAVNINPAGARKRAALGDVTNAGKTEAAEGKKSAKVGLVSKASQPTGVQKAHSRTVSQKTVLGTKETKKNEAKRTGAGSIGAASQKRKVGANTASIKLDEGMEDGEPLRKKAHILQNEAPIKPHPRVGKVVSKEEPEDDVVDFVEPEITAKPTFPPGVKDLDSEDMEDPLMAAEYATEIFEYLRGLEENSAPNPMYMDHQDDLEWKTRGILIDWLIEVHTRFHLLPETLFLAINVIDRFLSEKVVQLDRLQLVGITAMFIASKYEEILSPHVVNYVHVADDGFTEAEILSAERIILMSLNYDLSYPNPMNFLRRISKADNYDIQSRTIGKYLMEISLLDHRFMEYNPSLVAAAAMYLSRMILDRGEWDATLEYYSGYSEDEIEPVFKLMLDYLVRPVIHEAFFKKYGSKKFLKASLITRSWAKKNASLFDVRNTGVSLDEL